MAIATLALGLIPSVARAQAIADGAGRIEVAVGATWSGALPLAGPDALEADRNGGSYRLFEATSDLRTGPGIVTRIGVPLGSRLVAEAGLGYGAPELGLQVSSDVEDAAAGRLTETLSQLQFEAGLVAHLRRFRPGARYLPFVMIGGGYFRELHEGRTLAENGRSFFVGGGMKRLLRRQPASWLKAAGLRLDARLAGRSGGAALDDRVRFGPGVGASLFLRF